MRLSERTWLALGVGTACFAFAVLCWHFRHFAVDDTFISLRYARNLANGHGLTFNPGQPPTEGYSNFVWTLAIASLARVGLGPLLTAKALGVICGLLCVALTPLCLPGLAPSYRIAAAWLTALSPPVVLWSASGMRTALMALVLIIWILALQRWEYTPRNCLFIGLISALAATVRPEGILLWPAAVVVTLALRRSKWPDPLANLVLGAAAVAVPLTLFRLMYFHHLLPCPFYAKVEVGSLASHLRGLHYIYEFIQRYAGGLGFLLAAGLLLLARDDDRRRWWPLVAAVATWALYVFLVGDDWMPQFRFLVPIAAVAYMIDILLVERLAASLPGPPWARHAFAGAAICGVVYFALVGFFLAGNDDPHYRGYRMQINFDIDAVRRLRAQGQYLRAQGGSRLTVAARDVGIVGYISDATVIDIAGMTNYEFGGLPEPEAARRILDLCPDYIQPAAHSILFLPDFRTRYREVPNVPWGLWERIPPPPIPP